MMRKGRVGAQSSKIPPMQGLRGLAPSGMERFRGNVGKVGPKGGIPSSSPEYPVQPATNIENKLRYALLRKGVNFIEQASIGPWSIDFLLPDYMACVEADGEFWHSSTQAKMKDRRKDAWLRNKGYMVFHFDGKEIHQNSDYCVDKMMKSIEANIQRISEKIHDESASKFVSDDEYEKWATGR